MRILRKEDICNNLGYCAYYYGIYGLKTISDGTVIVDKECIEKQNIVVLLFSAEDGFIDNDGNINKECVVDKETGNKIYWLGGIKVYKTKDDRSNIDIIEATGRSHDYYVCTEEGLNLLLTGESMLHHHKLFYDNCGNNCFAGDDNASLTRNLMVMTDGNIRSANILVALDNRANVFFCDEKIYNYGEVAICYWSNDGKYICIPVKLTKDSYVLDIDREIKSNVISIKSTVEMIDVKRRDEELSDDILTGIIYTSLISAEDRLRKCQDEIVKDLLTYWKEYVDKVPVGVNVGDAGSFRDRAAKLLGL